MHQSEAVKIVFSARKEPKAVKVGAGKINVISGKSWDQTLKNEENDYFVIRNPTPLDGIKCGNNMVKQFVAMPMGCGSTFEGHVTGKEEIGGIQIIIYNKKQESSFSFFDLPPQPKKEVWSFGSSFGTSSFKREEQIEMGIAQGGNVQQIIGKDEFGIDKWDQNSYGRVFVHIVNGTMYKNITGRDLPPTPINTETYSKHGFPWRNSFNESTFPNPFTSNLVVHENIICDGCGMRFIKGNLLVKN
jgi:hypothetical protein